MNGTRLIRFSQSRTRNGVQMRAAGLLLRPSDAILILAARAAGGDPMPFEISSIDELRDDRDNAYDPGPWGTRYIEPTTWFFLQVPKPAAAARRLQIVIEELSCVPTSARPNRVQLAALVPYTRDLLHLPAVRTIAGPWLFDVPLRRQRMRTLRDA